MPHQRSFDYFINFAAYLNRLHIYDFPRGTIMFAIDSATKSIMRT